MSTTTTSDLAERATNPPKGGPLRGYEASNERGAVTAMVAILAVVMVASVLVLFDASRRLDAMSAAQDLASETARFAAAHVDQGSVFGGGAVISDEAEANAVAFALTAGATEATVEVAPDGLSVIATVTVDGGTAFTPGFDLSAEGQHQALVVVS